ncbi:hypothetical protein LTR62_001245 [Meristemomyces frigidus]|uniref:Uncharacterized protein n=1 Tax=Meristemomyces frigidus TaxID=1508187 RepID=A0AAN7T871_9PEZI|nr:hypothetical protein LTR62_001245 [Meristemomyces frigidus]
MDAVDPKAHIEEPQEHDFDQRHDGPFDPPRASVQYHRHSIGGLHSTNNPTSISPPPARKSMQIGRTSRDDFSGPARASTSVTRGGQRPSKASFDIRRDGPFGRPSLTMERRRSSGKVLPTTADSQRPVLTDTKQEEKAMEDRQQVELGETHGPEPAEASDLPLDDLRSDPAFEPEPPPLNYNMHSRKIYIIFFWSLIVVDCVFMPIGLYFGLWYGTNLSPNIVFSIVTAALGGVSIIEYVLRLRRLLKKNSTCRVIGARRMYLDWFHWNFTFGWMVVMIELIIGTIPVYPPIRLLAMPVTSMLYVFGTELLLVDILRYFRVPAPWRMSSIPRHAQLRPGIYSFIEDVVAVDGSGGTDYREAINRRYEASHTFRAMLRRLGVFWAVGAESCAVLCTILVFTIEHDAAYVVGWTVPFIWAGAWTAGTFWYVGRKLKEEKIAWTEEIAAKNSV